MKIQTYTPTGRMAKPKCYNGLRYVSAALNDKIRIECNFKTEDEEWRVTITRAEYEIIKAAFERE